MCTGHEERIGQAGVGKWWLDAEGTSVFSSLLYSLCPFWKESLSRTTLAGDQEYGLGWLDKLVDGGVRGR